MKKLILMIACLVSVTSVKAYAFGNDNQWQAGFGQGICESVITKGAGNKIYVAEDCGSGFGDSISFQIGGKSIDKEELLFFFDSSDPFSISINGGSITRDCNACEANFTYLLKHLCKHENVLIRTSNGDQTRFSLNGASKAIKGCSK